MTAHNSTPPPFLPLRSAVILAIALIIGGVMGWSTATAIASVPLSVAAGLGAAGTAIPVLDRLIGQ